MASAEKVVVTETGDVQEKDPAVAPAVVEPTPTKVSTRRAITDSEPLSEDQWMGPVVERPYADAISPEHRAYLEAIGVDIPASTAE